MYEDSEEQATTTFVLENGETLEIEFTYVYVNDGPRGAGISGTYIDRVTDENGEDVPVTTLEAVLTPKETRDLNAAMLSAARRALDLRGERMNESLRRRTRLNENSVATQVGANIMDAIKMIKMSRRLLDRDAIANTKNPTAAGNPHTVLDSKLERVESYLQALLSEVQSSAKKFR